MVRQVVLFACVTDIQTCARTSGRHRPMYLTACNNLSRRENGAESVLPLLVILPSGVRAGPLRLPGLPSVPCFEHCTRVDFESMKLSVSKQWRPSGPWSAQPFAGLVSPRQSFASDTVFSVFSSVLGICDERKLPISLPLGLKYESVNSGDGRRVSEQRAACGSPCCARIAGDCSSRASSR